MLDLPPFIAFSAVIFVGLVFGSFATALIYRVPRNISWWSVNSRTQDAVRSACTHCGEKLKPVDLIPLFSWLFNAGKCRYCRAPISLTYPLAELMSCAAVIGVYAVYGLSYEALFIMAVIPFLVALFFIDIETMRLPDQLVLISGLIGLFYVAFLLYSAPSIDEMKTVLSMKATGFFVYGALIWGLGKITSFVLKKPSLGFGDVKFYLVAGLWLGIDFIPVYMILCGICGIVFGLFYTRIYKIKFFPFGPAIILSLYICLILQGAGFHFLGYN